MQSSAGIGGEQPPRKRRKIHGKTGVVQLEISTLVQLPIIHDRDKMGKP